MPNEERSGGAAVYVPWATFNTALQQLSQGIPNQIDRSVFPGQSGAIQSQLLAALKFLGLINDDGKPLPSLHDVAVVDEAKRKASLKRIIEQRYADLFALDLLKTTPAEFSDRMSASYNVSGDTRKKAIRFFLSAATYLGIQLSPLLTRDKAVRAGANGVQPTRKRRANRSRSSEDEKTPGTSDVQPSGTARSIKLKSGGTLTISASLDLFSLNPADRTFVFGLIDRLDEYERASVTDA